MALAANLRVGAVSTGLCSVSSIAARSIVGRPLVDHLLLRAVPLSFRPRPETQVALLAQDDGRAPEHPVRRSLACEQAGQRRLGKVALGVLLDLGAHADARPERHQRVLVGRSDVGGLALDLLVLALAEHVFEDDALVRLYDQRGFRIVLVGNLQVAAAGNESPLDPRGGVIQRLEQHRRAQLDGIHGDPVEGVLDGTRDARVAELEHLTLEIPD